MLPTDTQRVGARIQQRQTPGASGRVCGELQAWKLPGLKGELDGYVEEQEEGTA